MKRWKKLVFVLLGVIGILTLSACGGAETKPASNSGTETKSASNNGDAKGAEATQPGQKSLVPLKVGVLKMAALTNPWVAQQEGIFEKNGLKVELVEFKAGGEAISAQQAGKVDIVLAIPGTAMTATERGFDLTAVFQNETAKTNGPDSGSVQVAIDSNIKSLADLAGKKVAVSSLHSQATVALQTLIQKAGVDLKKVQFIEIPYPSQVDVLKSKQMDAVATVDPYTTQLQSAGIGRVISWYYAEAIPEQPLGGWFAKSTFAKEKPKVIEAFNKSIKESIDYMLEDEKRAKQKVAEYTGLDPKLVQDMPLTKFSYNVNLDNWQKVVDMMVESGELSKPHKAEEYLSQQIKAFITK